MEEAEEAWAYRTVADRYDALAGSDIAALLVFAERQHVQPLPDAVSVHSAWDGLTGAGLWVRLNPDRAYLDWVSGATFEPSPPMTPAMATGSSTAVHCCTKRTAACILGNMLPLAKWPASMSASASSIPLPDPNKFPNRLFRLCSL